jgi:hypothetical protein
MTTIKQVFLSAAVAGVVAGAGSALGTAVAQAEPTDTGRSASSSESTGRADTQSPGRSRGSATEADTTSQIDSAPSAGDSETPTSGNTGRAPGSTRHEPAVDRATLDDDFEPSARIADQPDAPVEAAAAVEEQAPALGPIGTEVQSEVAAAPAAAIPTATAPAALASDTPEPAVAVEVLPVIAAAPQLSTAPASPAPTPVRLPLLPDLPAVPVAPASAVTVSATSGTNTRYRAASAVAQAEVLADPPINHVLLIGTDGTNLSKILEYAYDDPASGFRIAMEEGATGATSLIGHTTISGPSW